MTNYHDCYLKVFTRDKHWLPTLFLLLHSFQRANRKLIVNALTGAYLSLVSGNVTVIGIQPEAHFFLPHEMQIGDQICNLEPIYLLSYSQVRK